MREKESGRGVARPRFTRRGDDDLQAAAYEEGGGEGAGSKAAPQAVHARAAMSDPRVRVALIGAGIFARETYIPNLLAHKDRVKLVAVLSRSKEPIDEALALLEDEGAGVQKFFGSDGEESFFA